MRSKEEPRKKILRYIGNDDKTRPVYRDETGMIWKQLADGKFYFCFSFYGEAFRPMKEDIIQTIYEREAYNGH